MEEKEMLTIEIKGLLDEIRHISIEAKCDLTSDNLTEVVSETNKIRKILDHIDKKVSPVIIKEEL